MKSLQIVEVMRNARAHCYQSVFPDMVPEPVARIARRLGFHPGEMGINIDVNGFDWISSDSLVQTVSVRCSVMFDKPLKVRVHYRWPSIETEVDFAVPIAEAIRLSLVRGGAATMILKQAVNYLGEVSVSDWSDAMTFDSNAHNIARSTIFSELNPPTEVKTDEPKGE